MSMYRNRYFLLGTLFILLGVQFRMIDSFVLNESATRALAKITKETSVAETSTMSNLMMQIYPTPTKKVTPPRWLGLAFMAVGAVMTCHAISIPRYHHQHD